MASDITSSPRFAPVERTPTLSERVADALQDMILSGEAAPGDRLPSERELAELFGVSRTVIREAVRRLAGRGLVEAQTGSGIVVSEVHSGVVKDSMNRFLRSRAFLHPDRFSEALDMIHEVRTTLETRIAYLAAAARTPEDIERLEEAHALLTKAETSEEMADADVTFHRVIAAATHNDIYVALLDSIRDPLTDIRLATLELSETPDAVTGHRQVLDAIVAGDSEAAREAMAAHLSQSAAALAQLRPEHLRTFGP